MNENELPNQNNGCSEHSMDYLNKAAEACAAGDMTLGLHLYLAAYEKAMSEPGASTGMAVAALREAWHLACDLKERSMAEHVFEKLEPYLTRDEIAECASALQDLALDRLEEYGFSREELQDMAEAFSQDYLGGDASVVKVEHFTIPNSGVFGAPGAVIADVQIEARHEQDAVEDVPVQDEGQELEPAPKSEDPELKMGVAKVFNPYDMYPPSSEGTSWRAATNIGSGWSESVGFDGTTTFDSRFEGFSPVAKHEEETEPSKDPVSEEAQQLRASSEDAHQDAGETDVAQAVESPALESPEVAQQIAPVGAGAAQLAGPSTEPGMPEMPKVAPVSNAPLSYGNLVGYDDAVAIMRDYGFGLQNDAGFVGFVDMLNKQHGLSRMPAADTMLFRAAAIEDATRFVEATIGELGLPSLRMSMEEGVQGMPVLCVTADSNNRPRMNRQQNRFQGPAVLVIEDLDLWRMPEAPENVEGGMQAFMLANMTRGAREAINLIRSAVEDPDVFVLATSSTAGEVEPMFYEVLEPLTIIDIGSPNDKERADIWTEIMQNHPSTRGLDLDDLVKFSSGLARYDIYMAAREAVEEAYKMGLVQRGFVPVTAQNMLDKLASCQPFDSAEYRALEDRVVSDFVNGLDDLDQLFDGPQD